jgi:hypothetical protein
VEKLRVVVEVVEQREEKQASALIKMRTINSGEVARSFEVALQGRVEFGGECEFAVQERGFVEMSHGRWKLRLNTGAAFGTNASAVWFDSKEDLIMGQSTKA